MTHTTLIRPQWMSDGDFAWDFGPPRIPSTPDYRAVLSDLLESVERVLDTGDLAVLRDAQARCLCELAGVNP